MKRYPAWFLKKLRAIRGKRPRTVIEHILRHGFITTEELQGLYGYEHPPRAARDVREAGIPLETFPVKNEAGRTIAAYGFGDLAKARLWFRGRQTFSKGFKRQLIASTESRCSICLGQYEERYLQVDHRVPYDISGESARSEKDTKDYMLLCGSCNRAKSWSCEHCRNRAEQLPEVCHDCYWARPDDYKHMALKNIRRLDVEWSGDEVKTYESLQERAAVYDVPLPSYVKSVLKEFVEDE